MESQGHRGRASGFSIREKKQDVRAVSDPRVTPHPMQGNSGSKPVCGWRGVMQCGNQPRWTNQVPKPSHVSAAIKTELGPLMGKEGALNAFQLYVRKVRSRRTCYYLCREARLGRTGRGPHTQVSVWSLQDTGVISGSAASAEEGWGWGRGTAPHTLSCLLNFEVCKCIACSKIKL